MVFTIVCSKRVKSRNGARGINQRMKTQTQVREQSSVHFVLDHWSKLRYSVSAQTVSKHPVEFAISICWTGPLSRSKSFPKPDIINPLENVYPVHFPL